MPSLRRTVSSPLVRTNPYPSSLSASAAHASAVNGNTTATATRPRRSTSGSETAHRRVLADIEWWRVLDGQQPEEPELDEEQENDATATATLAAAVDVPASAITTQHAFSAEVIVAEHLLLASSPVSEVNAAGEFEASSLTTPFAALRISATSTPPLSPSRPRREASDASDLSDISFESIDSFDSFGPTPISSPTDIFMDTVSPFAALDNFDDARTSQGMEIEKHDLDFKRPSLHAGCLPMGRSLSFGGFSSTPLFEDEDRFDDMVYL